MEIAESVFEGVVETSYKKLARVDANRAGHSREIKVEAAMSNT